MRTILTLALAASLSACATIPDSTLTRIEDSYDRLSSAATLATPFMEPGRRARVNLVLKLLGAAIGAAREARTIQERDAALARANKALRALGDPPRR